MEILKYFTRSNEEDYIIYRLKEDELDNFIEELTEDFRKAYISDKKLLEVSKNLQMTKSDYLETHKLPDIGNIKSGDFGEILSFYVVREHYSLNKKIDLKGVYKWKWKDRNTPAPYTDGLLYSYNGKPSTKDILVAIEAKMKATPSKEHRIQDAIDGAEKDELRRLSSTLNWLKDKYANLGKLDKKNIIERFNDPVKFGSYQKKFKAIAVLDRKFEDEETNKVITNESNIVVIVFSIDQLKEVYEKTRQNVIDSV